MKQFEKLLVVYENEVIEESLSHSMITGGLLILSALSAMNIEAGQSTNNKIETMQKAKKMVIDDTVPLTTRIERLIPALEIVESNRNPAAVGDNGKAKGILQIWNVVIQDVNRIYKTYFTHDDAFDKEKAKEIASKYLQFYGEQYEKKTGKTATTEVLARTFNGGPNGYKNPNTLTYWEKVKIAFSKII